MIGVRSPVSCSRLNCVNSLARMREEVCPISEIGELTSDLFFSLQIAWIVVKSLSEFSSIQAWQALPANESFPPQREAARSSPPTKADWELSNAQLLCEFLGSRLCEVCSSCCVPEELLTESVVTLEKREKTVVTAEKTESRMVLSECLLLVFSEFWGSSCLTGWKLDNAFAKPRLNVHLLR